MKTRTLYVAGIVLLATTCVATVRADDATALAKKLANPVAALISAPIQANYDENFGPGEEGERWLTNVQPVIPITLNEQWNVISRTIVPIIDQKDMPLPGMNETGIGDITQSFFVSPKAPTASGWIWGAGPVLYLDTATDNVLGAQKWGAGPTAVVLKQSGSWTYGALVNQINSFAGDGSREDISSAYLQPFLAYVTSTHTTISLNTESTYDWKGNDWSVPVNFFVAQMLKAGDQIFQVGVGARYWLDTPDNGPDGWGLRLQLTFLFPKS
ncbi:MAG: transporter [Halioglobus sp.]